MNYDERYNKLCLFGKKSNQFEIENIDKNRCIANHDIVTFQLNINHPSYENPMNKQLFQYIEFVNILKQKRSFWIQIKRF